MQRIEREDFDSTREDVEHVVRQMVKVLFRTMYCSECGPKEHEIASFYCPCGKWLCALHLAMPHACITTASMKVSDEVRQALV